MMAFVDNTVEVDADIREVYDMWTAFEDFPAFMEVVERVDLVPDDSMHWVAVVEDDVIEWDADVVEHVPDQSVAWTAVDGRESGKVSQPSQQEGEPESSGQQDLLSSEAVGEIEQEGCRESPQSQGQ